MQLGCRPITASGDPGRRGRACPSTRCRSCSSLRCATASRAAYVRMLWTGLDAAGNTWKPLDNMTNCEDDIAAFEQATDRSLPGPAPPPSTGTAIAPPPILPTGFTVEVVLPRAWRSTDIHIEYSADACLCCPFLGRRAHNFTPFGVYLWLKLRAEITKVLSNRARSSLCWMDRFVISLA